MEPAASVLTPLDRSPRPLPTVPDVVAQLAEVQVRPQPWSHEVMPLERLLLRFGDRLRRDLRVAHVHDHRGPAANRILEQQLLPPLLVRRMLSPMVHEHADHDAEPEERLRLRCDRQPLPQLAQPAMRLLVDRDVLEVVGHERRE